MESIRGGGADKKESEKKKEKRTYSGRWHRATFVSCRNVETLLKSNISYAIQSHNTSDKTDRRADPNVD